MSQAPSIVDRLAACIPSLEAEWAEYRSGESAAHDAPSVQAFFLAGYVCDYLAAGKAAELGPFFVALDEAYKAVLTNKESVGLREGFMEDFIRGLEEHKLDPESAYTHLGSAARGVWEDCWEHLHKTRWREAAGA